MRIIAITNQKGGCGKTTTAINLSACLSQMEKKVLLIDLDPQGHATLGSHIKPQDLDKSMYDVLTPDQEKQVDLEKIIISSSGSFDLAPANVLLAAIEQELSGKPEREVKLEQAIAKMTTKKIYDFILIDSPPSLGLLTFNGLRASDEIITCVETGFYSLHGMSRLLEIVNIIERNISYKIKIKALITMFDRRTNFSKEIKDEIHKYFVGNVFNTIINNNVRLKESSSFGVPIITYDKRSSGAEDYNNLAYEVVQTEPPQRAKLRKENFQKSKKWEDQEKEAVLFEHYDPDADSVYIAGDFNGWIVDQKSKLQNTKEGYWTKKYNLEQGRYRYKFIVDGKWVIDATNPKTESDDVGVTNSVLEIS